MLREAESILEMEEDRVDWESESETLESVCELTDSDISEFASWSLLSVKFHSR